MRKEATEGLEKTRQRHNKEAELEHDDEGILNTPERRRRSNNDVIKNLEQLLTRKKDQQDELCWLRNREITVMESLLLSQQQCYRILFEQQHQFPQHAIFALVNMSNKRS